MFVEFVDAGLARLWVAAGSCRGAAFGLACTRRMRVVLLVLTSSCLQTLAVLKTLGVTNILAFGGVTICLLQSRCTLAAGNSKLL